MYFRATPANMTAVLICCLAGAAIIMLMRKRFDTNLPLLFYAAAFMFANAFDRPMNTMILYGGIGFALLLRFEFMGLTFTRFVAWFTNIGLVLMIWVMLSETGT